MISEKYKRNKLYYTYVQNFMNIIAHYGVNWKVMMKNRDWLMLKYYI